MLKEDFKIGNLPNIDYINDSTGRLAILTNFRLTECKTKNISNQQGAGLKIEKKNHDKSDCRGEKAQIT